MSALVRITTGIMPQHSRVGMSRAMAQFGEVIHCHKPPYSGIAGEDFVNVRFGNQEAADRAYAALKQNSVFVDGFQVGVGPTPAGGGGGGKGGGGGGRGSAAWQQDGGRGQPPALENHGRRRSMSPPRRYGRGLRERTPPRRGRSPPRRRSPSPRGGGANFPSRNDPKSPSPRRLAREMHMNTRGGSRSRSNHRRRGRGVADAFDGGFRGNMMALPSSGPVPRPTKPTRTPSPDPPGPAKNPSQVKNPFYKTSSRSPSPDQYEP
mmetsp:Transcript_5526/g.16344  ORF Transcript_5526/g.16344 Transcript_5526/m.16344 type:complete len:264 (-) Transcript_5526:16-807(-)